MFNHTAFDSIYRRALKQFPDAGEMRRQLPVPAEPGDLCQGSDAYYLSTMSRRVFRAGLRHAMVDERWPRFESAFAGFEPGVLAAWSDEQLEEAMGREGVIRHWGKVRAIRDNAALVQELSQAGGGFGRWLAAWPGDDIVGLWQVLKNRGAHLGGQSGPAFLRMVGKDTFLLSEDVVGALMALGVIDARPSSRRNQLAVQNQFNAWQRETGLPLCQLSRILSFTAG